MDDHQCTSPTKLKKKKHSDKHTHTLEGHEKENEEDILVQSKHFGSANLDAKALALVPKDK